MISFFRLPFVLQIINPNNKAVSSSEQHLKKYYFHLVTKMTYVFIWNMKNTLHLIIRINRVQLNTQHNKIISETTVSFVRTIKADLFSTYSHKYNFDKWIKTNQKISWLYILQKYASLQKIYIYIYWHMF